MKAAAFVSMWRPFVVVTLAELPGANEAYLESGFFYACNSRSLIVTRSNLFLPNHSFGKGRVARLTELMGIEPDTQAGEELDILATFIDEYEAKHHAIDTPDPIAAIEFRMEQQG